MEAAREKATEDSLAKLAAKKAAAEVVAKELDGAAGSAHDADDAEAKIWDEKYWKHLRTGNGKTTGFASYINSRLDELQDAPNEVMARLITKWHTHYKEPFPTLDKDKDNPDQGQGEDRETAHTVNKTGFLEIDQALDALGPDGPEIYDRAKNNLRYRDGAHTTAMAVEIAKEMSAIVDRGEG